MKKADKLKQMKKKRRKEKAAREKKAEIKKLLFKKFKKPLSGKDLAILDQVKRRYLIFRDYRRQG